MNSLPIIDISPLYNADEAGHLAVAEAIDRACREWGFFYIKGYPISAERIATLSEHARRFFALPAEQKLEIDITRSQHHRGYGAVATEQLDPSQPCDLKETLDRKSVV